MEDDCPKIKLILKNDKVLLGSFHTEQDERIELHDAFFSDSPSLIFNISLRLDDIANIIEIKDDIPSVNVLEFKTDDQYASDIINKKDDDYYVPHTIIKNGQIIVDENDLGRIEDIKVVQQETKSVNGYVPLYDQIKENEKRFGITIDFDESLYTSELDKESDFYKNNIERAKKIERQILNDKKRVLYEDEEGYSAVKTNENGWRKGNKSTKVYIKEEDNKNNIKQGRQNGNKIQNKEPIKSENANIIKDNNGETKQMVYDKKPVNSERGWRREQNKKNFVKKEAEEIVLPKSGTVDGSSAESVKSNGNKSMKAKTPVETWNSLNVDSMTSSSESKKINKTETKPCETEKRVSYGKPTGSKYKNLNDLYSSIVNSFKSSKETKKWGDVEDYTTFKGYSNDFYSYRYNK